MALFRRVQQLAFEDIFKTPMGDCLKHTFMSLCQYVAEDLSVIDCFYGCNIAVLTSCKQQWTLYRVGGLEFGSGLLKGGCYM